VLLKKSTFCAKPGINVASDLMNLAQPLKGWVVDCGQLCVA
jgi:hypothetical protein